MLPRGASTGIVRTRFVFASARYLLPESTWRAQTRRKSTANAARATEPSTATRSAICGVSRYGSSTRGSAGRNRRERRRSGKQPHLVHAVGELGRREDPPRQRIDGPDQD